MKHDYTLLSEDERPTPLGLIVLQTDETIEYELQTLFADSHVSLMVSRVKSDPVVSKESLLAMEPRLTDAAALLPGSVNFGAVGYGCTSGATVIGPERVAALVSKGCSTNAVTNPISAVMAASRALGMKRLGFITPYAPEVSDEMRKTLVKEGFEIAAFASFEEEREEMVARIDGASLRSAAASIAVSDCDGIFMSCTNLNVIGLAADLEAEFGKPVISSNIALAWDMARQAGVPMPDAKWGLLFAAK